MFQHEGNEMLGKRLSEDKQYAYHILTFVLPHLKDSDFLRCAHVCPLWKEILEETTRAKLKCMTPCENHIEAILQKYGEEIHALDLNTITITHVKQADAHIFSRLTTLKKLVVNQEILAMLPEINPNVQIVELKNISLENTLSQVVAKFPNLTDLSINFSSLEVVSELPLFDFRKNKKLKYLYLSLNCPSSSKWEDDLFREKIKWYNLLINNNFEFNKYRQWDWKKTEKMMETITHSIQLRIILDKDIIKTLDPNAGSRLPNTVFIYVDITMDKFELVQKFLPRHHSRITRDLAWHFYTIIWDTFGPMLLETYPLDDLWPLEYYPEIVFNTIYPKMEHLDLKERYWLVAFKNDIILKGIKHYLLLPKIISELYWTLKYKDFPLEPGYFLLEATDYSMSSSLPLEITEPTIHPNVIRVKIDLFAKHLNDSFNIKVSIEEIFAFEEGCPLY